MNPECLLMIPRLDQSLGAALPGADLISAGVSALKRGDCTPEALLVAAAATRLGELGVEVPSAAEADESPNLALYAAVQASGGGHSQYNALKRRLDSFIRAAAMMLPRQSPAPPASRPSKARITPA